MACGAHSGSGALRLRPAAQGVSRRPLHGRLWVFRPSLTPPVGGWSRFPLAAPRVRRSDSPPLRITHALTQALTANAHRAPGLGMLPSRSNLRISCNCDQASTFAPRACFSPSTYPSPASVKQKRDAFLPTSHLPARPAEIVDYTCRHPRRRARLRNPRKASASLRPTRKHTCSRKTVASNSNPLVPTLQAAAGRRPHTASRRSQAAAHRMAEKRGGRGAAPRTAAPVGSGGGRLRAGAL